MSGSTHMADPGIDPRRFRGVFLLILVVSISFLFFEMIRPFITALLLAAIFAALSNPAYRWLLSRTGERKALSAGITLLLFIVLLLGPLATFLGVVAQQAVNVSESVGPWVANMQAQLNEPGGVNRLIDRLPFSEAIRPYRGLIAERVGSLASSVGSFVVGQLAALTRGTVTFIFLLFIMLYAMFFFLRDGEALMQKLLYYLPMSTRDERRMLDKFVSVSRAMLKGTFLIGIVQGGLAGLGFWWAGIPSVAFWSTIMAVLSIVPGIGSALVWGPAGLYLLTTGETGAGIGLLVWCAVVVSSVDNVMRPWVVGRDTAMPDLMVLLGTLGGLVLFGAAGVIVGPIVAALFITVWELYGEAFSTVLPEASVEEATATAAEPGVEHDDPAPDLRDADDADEASDDAQSESSRGDSAS